MSGGVELSRVAAALDASRRAPAAADAAFGAKPTTIKCAALAVQAPACVSHVGHTGAGAAMRKLDRHCVSRALAWQP